MMTNFGQKKQAITDIVIKSIERKFRTYKPGTENMPFHYRLLGRDRMALYSFIQSLNTAFGTSIYEPAAIELAKGRFKEAKSHVKVFQSISSQSQVVIQQIMNGLASSYQSPNKSQEVEEIRKVSSLGSMETLRNTLVDIWLEDFNKTRYLIDLKTVKPNIGGFQSHKRTLLEWVASELAKDPNASVESMIAMPYNPFEPEPYKSWQLRGMLDLKHELLVGKDFWDFIGGEGSYELVLDCFEEAGIYLRPVIDEYFARSGNKA